ncbi:hypothetical protein RirG_000860 [Rhizophagus irregularis DAOM 197198w]|uniref:Uncharacterized protein n=1 Tax=Rhizophagus irregularis (strain DAOM 197198w) TaxID=1432141 RepID=A0A015NKH1_RHIIW|nr:hypothetical protein RirG_000860 [Rhizophagus irregularis DAOM 197198w]CAB5384122.1 unnamed protein product [Rhizophagus irregularis]
MTLKLNSDLMDTILTILDITSSTTLDTILVIDGHSLILIVHNGRRIMGFGILVSHIPEGMRINREIYS